MAASSFPAAVYFTRQKRRLRRRRVAASFLARNWCEVGTPEIRSFAERAEHGTHRLRTSGVATVKIGKRNLNAFDCYNRDSVRLHRFVRTRILQYSFEATRLRGGARRGDAAHPGVHSRRRYLRYCYHSIFNVH